MKNNNDKFNNNLSDKLINGSKKEKPNPHQVEIANVGEETEGYLVTVKGTIIEIKRELKYQIFNLFII